MFDDIDYGSEYDYEALNEIGEFSNEIFGYGTDYGSYLDDDDFSDNIDWDAPEFDCD